MSSPTITAQITQTPQKPLNPYPGNSATSPKTRKLGVLPSALSLSFEGYSLIDRCRIYGVSSPVNTELVQLFQNKIPPDKPPSLEQILHNYELIAGAMHAGGLDISESPPNTPFDNKLIDANKYLQTAWRLVNLETISPDKVSLLLKYMKKAREILNSNTAPPEKKHSSPLVNLRLHRISAQS